MAAKPEIGLDEKETERLRERVIRPDESHYAMDGGSISTLEMWTEMGDGDR